MGFKTYRKQAVHLKGETMETKCRLAQTNENDDVGQKVDQERRAVLKTIVYAAPVTIMLLTAENATPQSNPDVGD